MKDFNLTINESFTDQLNEDVKEELRILIAPFIETDENVFKLKENNDAEETKKAMAVLFPEKSKDISDMMEFYEVEYDALVDIMVENVLGEKEE